MAVAAAVSGSFLAAGCITVNAPEEPIVIELNINITQEVIYRLAEDVRENIDENPEIF
jgi:outer membrane murein-binding lipoprotein Lpp